MKRLLSGIQPTGYMQLGNYLGAIKQWVALQEPGNQNLYCIVDQHAITLPQNPEALRSSTLMAAAVYIAAGIDPERSSIFVQSHVPAHAQLGWILNCFTPLGWLNRMTQFKEKSGKHKEQACLGLYGYPVLMAADILLYHATHVPVGDDQKQHIELARDIAGAFNRFAGNPILTIPEPMIQGLSTRVMSLRDGTAKMSKSDPSDMSRINLTDTPEVIEGKIRKAKTDSDPLPGSEKGLEGRPEALNLMSIYGSLTGKTLNQVCAQFEGQTFAPFKKELAEVLIATLNPIRLKMEDLLKDQAYLTHILGQGSVAARTIADKTLKDVSDAVGFLPPA